MRSLVLTLLLVTASVAQQSEPGRGVNFYSLEKEVALGRQLAGEFTRDHKLLENPAVKAYLDDLGKRLVGQTGGPQFTYSFSLFADDTPYSEAVALPGGFVFVPSSVLLAAKGEDEFAGVLAHSIAHIASRHGTKQATKAELVNVASTPLVFMGGWTGFAMRQGAELAIPLGLIQFWRRFELDADRLAVTQMAAAGYDPEALVRYLGRELVAFEGHGNPQFSPLPPLTQRLDAIQAVIASLPAQTYAPHDGFDKIQAEVRRLTASFGTPMKPRALVH